MKKNTISIYQLLFVITVMSIIVLLLIQNLTYRKKYENEKIKNNQYENILKAVEFENNLKTNFLFEPFPIEICVENFYMFQYEKMRSFNHFLIMVFDLTVCGKCMHEELELLKDYKDLAENKGIIFLALVGTTDKSEESEIINLYRSKILFFPFKIINVSDLYKKFQLEEGVYLDTPFFIYTSIDLKILDIYKPIYLDTKELRKWLEIITT